jgi:hypothetical protein
MTYWYFVIFILSIILFTSCVCPTDLDDDGKIVKPTVYCNVNFISASPDNRNLSVKTEFRTILDDLDYNNKIYTYQEAEAKKTTLKVHEGENLLYQNLMSLEEKNYYSCFVYGINSWIKVLMLNDRFGELNKAMSNYRVINLCEDAPELLVRINGDTQRNFLLSYESFGEITEARSRKYDVDIYDAAEDTLMFRFDQEIELRAGYFYNFVIRGYSSLFHHIRFECIITENKIINP